MSIKTVTKPLMIGIDTEVDASEVQLSQKLKSRLEDVPVEAI